MHDSIFFSPKNISEWQNEGILKCVFLKMYFNFGNKDSSCKNKKHTTKCPYTVGYSSRVKAPSGFNTDLSSFTNKTSV